jgi:hypothetical protein
MPSLPSGETRALQVARDYAEEKRWEIYRFPTRADFDASKSEWRCVIKVKNGDFVNDYFVYVNDITRQVRHVRGE